MNSSTGIISFVLALVASNSVLAQERFSIEIPSQMDAVSVEKERFGRTSSTTLFVRTIEDSNKRTPSFNQNIKALGIIGKIDSCSLLIEVPAGKNQSYGGFCSLIRGKKKRNVYICNDDIVGHFALYHASVTSEAKHTLIKFVVSNCIGG